MLLHVLGIAACIRQDLYKNVKRYVNINGFPLYIFVYIFPDNGHNG
jgi:hypothetical protein